MWFFIGHLKELKMTFKKFKKIFVAITPNLSDINVVVMPDDFQIKPFNIYEIDFNNNKLTEKEKTKECPIFKYESHLNEEEKIDKCSSAKIQEKFNINSTQQSLLEINNKKIEKMQRHIRLKHSPQAQIFCQEMRIGIEEIALASKMAGRFVMKPTNLSNSVKFAGLMSNLLKLIPIAGEWVYALVNGLASTALAIDSVRQANAIAAFSHLGTIKDFMKVAEEVALTLTEMYFPYLETIMTPEEKKQLELNKEKNENSMDKFKNYYKEFLDNTLASALKISLESDISVLVNYAVSHILICLIEGKISSNLPLAPQFVEAITQPLSMLSQLQYALKDKVGKQTIVTREGKILMLEEFYQNKPIPIRKISQSINDDSINELSLSATMQDRMLNSPLMKEMQDKILILERQLQDSREETKNLKIKMEELFELVLDGKRQRETLFANRYKLNYG